MDVKNMIEVGFDFLNSYILSANESEGSLERIMKKTAYQSAVRSYPSYQGGYGTMISYSYAKPKVQPEPEEDATFKLKKETKDLKHLDIIWNLALECQNENVVPKAIDFLIKSYTSFVDEIEFESSD